MTNETFYMNPFTGYVATMEEWESDFDSTDVETWFGLPVEECEGLHWLADSCLIEVTKNSEGEWVEA